jgi:hypothetical protein
MISSRLRDRRRLRGISSSFNGTTSLPYELSNKPLANTIVRSPLTTVVDGPDGNRPAVRGPISFGADVFVAVLSDGIAQPFLTRPGERGELIRFIDDSKRSLVRPNYRIPNWSKNSNTSFAAAAGCSNWSM